MIIVYFHKFNLSRHARTASEFRIESWIDSFVDLTVNSTSHSEREHPDDDYPQVCFISRSFSIVHVSIRPLIWWRRILKKPHSTSSNMVDPIETSKSKVILNLPEEIVNDVANFLELQDASRFSRCCKRIQTVFPLNTKNPPTQLVLPGGTEFIGEYSDQNRPGPEIPVDSNRVHTVVLETTWKDQGWGNYKGTLFILGYDSNCSTEDRTHFSRGRIVQMSPLARHEETPLRMKFRPRSGETYRLWIFVGCGGGHILVFVTPLRMYAVGPQF
jgi:hypothetical protein